MKIGAITCNFYTRIFNYTMPEDFNWGAMSDRYRTEYSLTDTENLLKEIAALGYDAAELWEPTGSHLIYSLDGAKIIKKMANDLGLDIPVYCIGGWRNSDVDGMEKAYLFAKALGASVITGCMPKDDSDKAIDKMDELGEKYGIYFAIENHPVPSFSNPADVKAVIEAHSKWVGANLDTGIYIKDGYDPIEAAKMFGDKLYHVHFKDSKPGVRGCFPIGDGELDYPAVIKHLVDTGYDRMLSVEFEFHSDPTPGMKISIERIKKVLEDLK